VVIVTVKPTADAGDKKDFRDLRKSKIELDECIFGNSAMYNLIGSVDEIMKQARNPMFTIHNDRPGDKYKVAENPDEPRIETLEDIKP